MPRACKPGSLLALVDPTTFTRVPIDQNDHLVSFNTGALMNRTTLSMPQDEEGFLNLSGRYVTFLGRLGGVNRREASDLVRQQGAVTVTLNDPRLDLIVVGAEESPLNYDTLIDSDLRQHVENQGIEILLETQLWDQLGLVDQRQNSRQLYTPAMLADLLGVAVSIIRRWHRRKLIVPTREVHRLPYFDFQEVATARNLAQLLAAGASPEAIEKKLADLKRLVPDVERPLAQLSVIVEGRQLLLRQGEGLIETGGQRRFDFEAAEVKIGLSAVSSPTEASVEPEVTLPFLLPVQEHSTDQRGTENYDTLVRQAELLEDTGSLSDAADAYRSLLMSFGPRAELHFRLAEVLYRLGDTLAARERYYVAIELDEDYVEARANLGCVLAETNQLELAVAAFQGALAYHDGYPDVHYHLARCLDELGHTQDSVVHWQRFLALAPQSPWSNEARDRLGLADLPSRIHD